MAWRLTRYQTFATGTTITSAFLNAAQDAIIALFNGTYSVKKLFVDGTGDQAASYAAGVIAKITGGAIQLDGASGDSNPAIVTSVTPSARKLLWRIFHLSGGGVTGDLYCRLYIDATNNAISLVFNATWNGSQWALDESTQPAYRVLLGWGTKAIGYQTYSGATPYNEGSWTDVLAMTAGGAFSSLTAGLLTLTTARTSSTLGSGQSVAHGVAYKDTLDFATGRFDVSGGAVTAVRSANIASVTYSAAGTYVINLQTAAPNVIGEVRLATSNSNTPAQMQYTVNSTSQVTVYHFTTGIGLSDPAVGFSFSCKAS